MKKKPPRDRLYAEANPLLVDFEFNESVANVFPDMIRRSVPGYSTIISLIGLLAEQYAQPASQLYDLGCSLGAATLSMRHRLHQPNCKIIAVDSSQAMITRCQENIADDLAPTPIELQCADIRDIAIENACVVVLNFTLQFIAPAERQALLQRIYQGLLPGGVLLLSEKITFDDPTERELQIELYHAFKRANGYSDLEISQKRNALENVLIPDTLEQHQQRLQKIGFESSRPWFQCFNFLSLLAIK